jgi:hypothetical protein
MCVDRAEKVERELELMKVRTKAWMEQMEAEKVGVASLTVSTSPRPYVDRIAVNNITVLIGNSQHDNRHALEILDQAAHSVTAAAMRQAKNEATFLRTQV